MRSRSSESSPTGLGERAHRRSGRPRPSSTLGERQPRTPASRRAGPSLTQARIAAASSLGSELASASCFERVERDLGLGAGAPDQPDVTSRSTVAQV